MVEAGRDRCIAVLLDVERYPEWYDTLDDVRVEGRDADGRPETVTIEADAGPLGALSVQLRFSYELPDVIAATQTGGDGRVTGFSSRWELAELGSELTRVSYSMEAKAGDRRTAVAMRVAAGLLRPGLVDDFPKGLRRRVEATGVDEA